MPSPSSQSPQAFPSPPSSLLIFWVFRVGARICSRWLFCAAIFSVQGSYLSVEACVRSRCRCSAAHSVGSSSCQFGFVKIDNLVIDCVDIYKQPAFQHPLLVNHTIQLKPNYPVGKINDLVTKSSHPWNSSKSCPEGSIPIERTTRYGQFPRNISKMHSHKHPNYFHPQTVDKYGSVHEHSLIRVYGDKLFGGKADLNVWNPKIDKQSYFSLAQLWITNKDFQDWLEAGWTVYPNYYGTAEPRFFIFRTADKYRTTGCYNLDCPGFVQTNRDTILGIILQPSSVYGGEQYHVHIEIFQDKTSGNWWVRLQGMDMGYWPKEIAPTLAQGATIVDFGGEVCFDGVHPNTEMGSGHFSYEGFGKSSFFKNVQVLDSSYVYQTPNSGDVKIFKENEKYYDLQVGENVDDLWGLYFFYGGPGGNP